MKSTFLYLIIIFIVIGLGAYFLIQFQAEQPNVSVTVPDAVVEEIVNREYEVEEVPEDTPSEEHETTSVVAPEGDEETLAPDPSEVMMSTELQSTPERKTTPAVVPIDTPEAVIGQDVQSLLVAGGCFWCVEADLEKLTGVATVISGYAGGENENPTYENYDEGGHREVVLVIYDANRVSYGQILEYAIKHMDPTDPDGSFGDRGVEYSPAIYYENQAELAVARQVIQAIDDLEVYEQPLALAIEPRTRFWTAEDYHQDYYKKNPIRYNGYRLASGRDAFIKKHWGEAAGEFTVTAFSSLSPTLMQKIQQQWGDFQKPDDETLKSELTDLQYRVTQKNATERAYQNDYHDNKQAGLYVDVVSGEPLFSSSDKFDSGTGWPSFTKPLYPEAVTEHKDYKLILPRTEIRSKYADSHLGHVFNDAPKELGGVRYCMNSAALRFIAKEDLEKEGYGEFVSLFES